MVIFGFFDTEFIILSLYCFCVSTTVVVHLIFLIDKSTVEKQFFENLCFTTTYAKKITQLYLRVNCIEYEIGKR